MIRFTDNHRGRLARMSPSLMRVVLGQELEYAAGVIVKDAADSIDDGAIRGPGHVPAPPFGPPNSDTGDLVDSGHVADLIDTSDEVRSGAVFDSDHALYQERGTSKMLPRPFLEPAAERARPDVREAVVKRVREVRGG